MSQEVIEITEREIEVIEVVEKGPAGPVGPQANINYTVVSSPQTLSNSQNIAADTSGGSFTLTLPANPNAGDSIDIFDYSETFDTNPLTIARNGENIESIAEDLICNVEGAYFTMIYTGATRGWQILPRYGTTGGGGESVLTTEGDMVYRGAAINERLPIGSAGQILKVNSGGNAPEWGAAPATGVTSVGVTGSDGIEVDSGSPVTGSGTIALGVNAATLRSHINVADGANNYTHPNHSGEVTSSGDGATTIANDVVTNAKLANVATATIKGRATAGTGDPEDLSASQVRTILNVADGAEVNVQSNWTESDSGSDAFILNKPSIPTASSATPQALGVAAAGTSVDFARADHVHAMPSAADVGAAPATGIDPTAITGTAVVDSDARLSDSRSPLSHAASHASAGSDPLFDQNLNTTDAVTFESVTATDLFGLAAFEVIGVSPNRININGELGLEFFGTTAASTRTNLGLGTAAVADIGNGAGDVAEGDHAHGTITSDGKIGSTSGLPLKTGTAGVVEAGAFGVNAGEFAEGNHTHTQLHDKSHTMTDATSHTAGNHKVFYSDGSGQIQELALGNSGEVLTSNGASAAPSFAAASGGIGGGTGSVDNALLRADGTGGSTAQDSALVIDDATTSTQANVAIVNAHSETNSSVVITPKGTGAFILGPKPDGTSTGGNARGASAVDLQSARSAATQVASGRNSVLIGGAGTAGVGGGTASGPESICIGAFGVASGQGSIVLGGQYGGGNTASNTGTVALGGFGHAATSTYASCLGGQYNTASGVYSVTVGGQRNTASATYSGTFGFFTLADRYGIQAHAGGRFATTGTTTGDAQRIRAVLRCKTTTDSAVEMALDGSTTYLTIPSGKVIFCNIKVVGVKSDGSAVATYERQYAAKNVAATSSQVFAPVTIGSDNPSGTVLDVTTQDVGDYISIKVTGIASETWRWTASVDAVEVAYGT